MQRKVFLAGVCLMLMLSGCSSGKVMPAVKQIAVMKNMTQDQDEETTEKILISEREEQLPDGEYSHIYDECNACSGEELRIYNNYLEWLYQTRKLTASVVITQNLGGQTPEEYAKNRYEALPDAEKQNGILFLINNDTYQDYIYTAGSGQHWISAYEIRIALAQATPALVEKRYTDAFEILLTLGEKVPPYVLGWTDVLTDTEISEFSQLAQQKQCAVILFTFPDDAKELDSKILSWEKEHPAKSYLFLDPKKKLCRTDGNVSENLKEELLNTWEKESLPQGIRKFFEKMQN